MIDVFNRVLSNVTYSVKDICSNIASANSDTPPDFPCLQLSQIDNLDTADDLENSENAVESVIEIQTYSNRNLNESRKIINVSCDAMRQMGYRRIMGPKQIANVGDGNIYRMVARFRRIIGNGEEIKKFESN